MRVVLDSGGWNFGGWWPQLILEGSSHSWGLGPAHHPHIHHWPLLPCPHPSSFQAVSIDICTLNNFVISPPGPHILTKTTGTQFLLLALLHRADDVLGLKAKSWLWNLDSLLLSTLGICIQMYQVPQTARFTNHTTCLYNQLQQLPESSRKLSSCDLSCTMYSCDLSCTYCCFPRMLLPLFFDRMSWQ